MTEEGTKGPGAVEGRVRGDGDSGDAHDDVRHRHVDQVHPGVHPQIRSEPEKCHEYLQIGLHLPENNIKNT